MMARMHQAYCDEISGGVGKSGQRDIKIDHIWPDWDTCSDQLDLVERELQSSLVCG
jgi:hypothetical protein